MKKIFILLIFALSFLNAVECGKCYYDVQSPDQLECPIFCSLKVPCSLGEGIFANIAGYKCVGPSESGINTIVVTSLLIISVEISALAIVYALGKAFSYEKLVTYSKGELTQALANIVLISIILSILKVGEYKNVFSNLQANLSGINSKVINYAFGPFGWNTIVSAIESITLSFKGKISIPVAPPISVDVIFGFGDFQFIDGIAAFLDAVDRVLKLFSDSYVLLLATEVFLYFIEGMLPIFLYVGLLLRVIPWTRSAGGYLIAYFISFYLFYPFLLSFLLSLPLFQRIEFVPPPTSISTYSPIFPNVELLENFSASAVNVIIKFILPILLCFIVSLMLAEEVGAILGSYLTRAAIFRLI